MSLRTALLVWVLIHSMPAGAQNLPVGKRTITFTDGNRSNRTVPTELYYPATVAGNNTPLAGGTEKYPVVVFGHGFVMTPAAYVWLADSLVKYGFIVALPSTESSFSPSHEQFGRDLAFLAQRVCSLNDSTGNFLYGRVSNKTALGGHSMGGGCSFLGMTYNAQVLALFNFAAAETTPSAKTAANSIQKPALIFSGSSDCIVAPAEQQVMYNNIPYPCKSYVNITGGLHCHFGNNDATCVFGQVSSGCNTSAINTSVLFNKTISLLHPFLQHYLKADCGAASMFKSTFAQLTGATTLRVCNSDPLGCVVTGVPTSPGTSPLLSYPNPAPVHTGAMLALNRGRFEEISVFDANGSLIQTQRAITGNSLTLHAPGSGIYLVRAKTSMGIFFRRIVFHNE
ncbi:MAG: T9SS type A sorting domain-containing protein [Bacteroidetes bacterium]|nr:T9SS type A sorting domain-containing protein [Bacteroidota bacterium]